MHVMNRQDGWDGAKVPPHLLDVHPGRCSFHEHIHRSPEQHKRSGDHPRGADDRSRHVDPLPAGGRENDRGHQHGGRAEHVPEHFPVRTLNVEAAGLSGAQQPRLTSWPTGATAANPA